MLGEVRKVRIYGLTDMLGSVTSEKEVYTKYIASRCETDEEKDNAKADGGGLPDVGGKITGFYRDKDGNPVLKGYQVKGFLKEAAKALRGTFDVMGSTTTSQSKIDNLIFINDVDITLHRGDEIIIDTDGFLERPLRAMTMQGPRVGLAKSEVIKAGWWAELTVQFIPDVTGGRAKSYTWDTIEKMFSYGELKGLLQWRNAGYGSFKTEWLTEE